MNFVDLLGKKEPLKMVVPSNANISGYDSIVYEVYFGELKDAERSSFVAMENSMAKFIEYAEEIMKKEVLTMAVGQRRRNRLQRNQGRLHAVRIRQRNVGRNGKSFHRRIRIYQAA